MFEGQRVFSVVLSRGASSSHNCAICNRKILSHRITQQKLTMDCDVAEKVNEPA